MTLATGDWRALQRAIDGAVILPDSALVEGLGVELAARVRVNAVAPTFMGTRTAFWRDVPAEELRAAEVAFSEQLPLKRIASADEVASAYVHLFLNGFITGQTLAVDGGVMLQI